MNTMLPRAHGRSSFLQSMKQICVSDVASCRFPSTGMAVVHGFPIAVKNQIVSVSVGVQHFHIVPIWERSQIVIDFIPRKDGAGLCLGCTQHLAVCTAELFCHFSARAHSCTHWYSCSYYPPQSAAEKLWLMATVRAIFQWFIKQDWHE